jgi:hypothetical protein
MPLKLKLKKWAGRVLGKSSISQKSTANDVRNHTDSITSPVSTRPLSSGLKNTDDNKFKHEQAEEPEPAQQGMKPEKAAESLAKEPEILPQEQMETDLWAALKLEERGYTNPDLNWVMGRACSLRHRDVVERLLEHGMHPSDQSTYKDPGCWSETPLAFLHYAVRGKAPDITIIKLLLERGAFPSPRARCWGTPLHYAALDGVSEIAKLLLDHGAEVNARDAEDETPLHVAARSGKLEIVNILLARGANPNAYSRDGRTPMALATLPPGMTGASYSQIVDRLREVGGQNIDRKLDTQNRGGMKRTTASYNGHNYISSSYYSGDYGSGYTNPAIFRWD